MSKRKGDRGGEGGGGSEDETWLLRVADKRRLEVFDSICLRRIHRPRRTDRVSCADPGLCERRNSRGG